MKLENQVCSLELAKRLKELKVKQESLWCYERIGTGEKDFIISLMQGVKNEGKNEYYSAFTVAESGEMLPEDEKYDYYTRKGPEGAKGKWMCVRIEGAEPVDFLTYWELAVTEANARAKMKIWLVEQEKVKV